MVKIFSLGPQKDTTRDVGGLRSDSRDYMDMPGERDCVGAKAMGPKRAARVISPTRDVKEGRLYRRQM